jgi:serine/threonine-protein kinase
LGVVLLVLAGAFAVGILVFNFVLMPRLVQHDVTVQVPQVVGLGIDAARRVCAQAGLQCVEEDRRHSDDLPPDHVVSQAPAAATAVKRGRSVRVVVSLGQQQVVVPDLRGMTLRQASLQLANAHLVLGDVARIHAGAEGTTVRATVPPAGAQTALGDSIDVLVAVAETGEPYVMPSFVGQDANEVRSFVEARGFRIGRLTYRAARGVYPGTVLEQYPLRGSLIRRGEAIDLVVANPD